MSFDSGCLSIKLDQEALWLLQAAWLRPGELDQRFMARPGPNERSRLARTGLVGLGVLIVAAFIWGIVGSLIASSPEAFAAALEGLLYAALILGAGYWLGQPARGLMLALTAGIVGLLALVLMVALPAGVQRDFWVALVGGAAFGFGLSRLYGPRGTGLILPLVGVALSLTASFLWTAHESAVWGGPLRAALFVRFLAVWAAACLVAASGAVFYLPELLLTWVLLGLVRRQPERARAVLAMAPILWDDSQFLPLLGSSLLLRVLLGEAPQATTRALYRVAVRGGRLRLAAAVLVPALGHGREQALLLSHWLGTEASALSYSTSVDANAYWALSWPMRAQALWRILAAAMDAEVGELLRLYGGLCAGTDLPPNVVPTLLEQFFASDRPLPLSGNAAEVLRSWSWARRVLTTPSWEACEELRPELASLLSRPGEVWLRAPVRELLADLQHVLVSLSSFRGTASRVYQVRYLRMARSALEKAEACAEELASLADRSVWDATIRHLHRLALQAAQAREIVPQVSLELLTERIWVPALPAPVEIGLNLRADGPVAPRQVALVATSSDPSGLRFAEPARITVQGTALRSGGGRINLPAWARREGQVEVGWELEVEPGAADAAAAPLWHTIEIAVRSREGLLAFNPYAPEAEFTPERAALFRGRAETDAWIVENLAEAHLLVHGLPGMGKTWLLRHLSWHPPLPNVACAYVACRPESATEPGVWVWQLALSISAALNTSLIGGVGRREWIADWPRHLKDLMARLAGRSSGQLIVLLLDDAQHLLARSFDARPSESLLELLLPAPGQSDVRVLLAGNHELEQACATAFTPALGHIRPWLLPPLSMDESLGLIREPLAQVLLPDPAAERLLAESCGGHPGLIQWVCHELIAELVPAGNDRLAVGDARRVLRRLASSDGELLSRLLRDFTAEQHLALAVLSAGRMTMAAGVELGALRALLNDSGISLASTRLVEALEGLQHRGLVVATVSGGSRRYRPAIQLLAAWQQAHHELTRLAAGMS